MVTDPTEEFSSRERIRLLSEVVDHPQATDYERKAFRDMLDRVPLTDRQSEWLAKVRDRLGLTGAANTFSGWSEARKAEKRKRAGRVLLPQEMPGYVKPTKLR